MRILIFVLFVFSINLTSAQSVEWFKSFDMDGMDFRNHRLIRYKSENILIGVKAIDSTSTAYYENELYLYSLNDNSNLLWSLKFKPLDSVSCSEIVEYNSYIIDSFLVIFGSCYLNSNKASVYYYSTINLKTREIKSYNLGRQSFYTISYTAVNDKKLLLYKTMNASNVGEVLRIDIKTNATITKPLNLPFASKLYLNHHFYTVKDSTSNDNKIILLLSKIDTNGNLINSNIINTNLVKSPFGFNYEGFAIRNGNVFVYGTYEYHSSNPTITGYIFDFFLFKIDANTLQGLQSFALSEQFPNEIKSKQEIEFDAQGDNTFIIAKVINDNNLRNVHSYLMSNNGIIWSKKLTEPSVNQLHKRFVNADILNNNNFVNLMSSLTGNITLANFNSAGTLIDSFDTKIDTNSASIDVQESFLNRNDNNIYLVGSHVIKSDNKLRLYIAKVNYLSTSTNLDKHTPITIYPNPSANTFTVDVNDVNTLTLYNSLGAKIKATSYTNIINVEDLPNGIYYLQILTKQNKHYSEKVIVQK